MKNQITTPKIDWRTKKVSDHDLAVKLFNATIELFQFIHKNSDKIAFANIIYQKREGTGETTYVKVPDKLFPEAKWIKPIYDLEYTPTHYTSDRFHININGSDYSRISLKTKEYIACNRAYTSHLTFTSDIVIECSPYHYTDRSIYSMIDNIRIFIKRIPKKSRNKIIKMLYWLEYTPVEERGFIEYAALYKRMRTYFDMEILEKWWNDKNKLKFDRIIETYDQVETRNRRINKLLRRK